MEVGTLVNRETVAQGASKHPQQPQQQQAESKYLALHLQAELKLYKRVESQHHHQ